MITNNNHACPSCGSNHVLKTYDTIECYDCFYIHVFQPNPEFLKNEEIINIVTETIKKYNITDPAHVKIIIDSICKANTSINNLFGDIFEHNPVEIEELLDSDKYLGPITRDLYPKIREEIILTMRNPNIKIITLSGSLGWGKTFYLGIIMMAIHYYLCCLKSPQKFFNLAEQSYLGFFNYCTNETLAHKTLFSYLINNYDGVPWFRQYAPRNQDKTTEIDVVSKKIIFRRHGPNAGAVIGTNLHTFIGDEVNFMQVIKDSKRSSDGEEYNEAKHTYEVLRKRQTSRITNNNPYCPPRVFQCSSEQFPDDFLPNFVRDLKSSGKSVTREQLISGDYDKRNKIHYNLSYANWETKPKRYFEGWTFQKDDQGKLILGEDGEPIWKTFQVGLNHPKKGDKLLDKNESIVGFEQILNIPIFYKPDFEGDTSSFYKAIRDIAGVPTIYSNPWFSYPQIVKCMNSNRKHPSNYQNPTLMEKDFKLDIEEMFKWNDGKQFINPDKPRFIHLDLSKNNDHSGITVCHVAKRVKVIRKMSGELVVESLPFFFVDLMLRIKPPSDGKAIDYSKIRNIIYLLRKKGMFIKKVTYDKVQGEMGTFLEKNDIEHDYLSVDKQIEPWSHLSQVFSENRIDLYHYDPLENEMPYLFFDEVKKKVDHRPNKFKDLSDSLVGSVWNAVHDDDNDFENFMLDFITSESSRPETIFERDGVSNFYGEEYKSYV